MMKPVLVEAHNSYLKKTEEAEETKKASSISSQTTQWQSQQRSVEIPSKDWNIQDALKGVVGVGTAYSEEEK